MTSSMICIARMIEAGRIGLRGGTPQHCPAPWRRWRARAAIVGATLAWPLQAVAGDGTGWGRWGMDDGGQRFSRAGQITPANVDRLERAWATRTGDLGQGFASAGKLTFQATPVLAERTLYLVTGFNRVLALDATSGAVRWRADAGLDPAMRFSEVAARGVTLWNDPAAAPGSACARRVLLGTLDGRLLALDAADGARCADFGSAGAVDLREGVRLRQAGQYQVTSPPALVGDRVIVGSAIGDNRAVELEYGIVRAYGARSGALLWAWDPIPRASPDAAVAQGWEPASAEGTGAANAWAPLSADPARNLVFVPTGSASPDFFGGGRPGPNRHASSLVALDARDGSVVWARQLVHHDLWDYDVPAQPVLVDLTRDGQTIPAVVQATKMGLLFVLDRTTGEPVFGIAERPVPASDVPGETAAATQPFPLAPPPLVPHDALRPEDAWGFTFLDRRACAARLEGLRSEGLYTPPSLQGTVMLPSYAGGSNWGGLAVDSEHQIAFANVSNIAAIVRLVPREAAGPDLPGRTEMAGTPYVLSREILRSPLGAPCNPPPWAHSRPWISRPARSSGNARSARPATWPLRPGSSWACPISAARSRPRPASCSSRPRPTTICARSTRAPARSCGRGGCPRAARRRR